MDQFILTGSEQACNVLNKVGSTWYHSTCIGFENADPYYRAGVLFWGCVGVLMITIMYAIRKSLGYAFN